MSAHTAGSLPWHASRLSAFCQEKKILQWSNLCLAHPLDLLKDCGHTQSKEFLCLVFLVCTSIANFFLKIEVVSPRVQQES